MYECLVGYTPFYAEDPVTTCRKILNWRRFLEVPQDTSNAVSSLCLDFMLALIADSEIRLGSRDLQDITVHEWFSDWSTESWEHIRQMPAPHEPEGSQHMAKYLQMLRTVDPGTAAFAEAIKAITANFEHFDESGLWEQPNRVAHRRDRGNEFIGYTFKRKVRAN